MAHSLEKSAFEVPKNLDYFGPGELAAGGTWTAMGQKVTLGKWGSIDHCGNWEEIRWKMEIGIDLFFPSKKVFLARSCTTWDGFGKSKRFNWDLDEN